jgi:hypothetical protein
MASYSDEQLLQVQELAGAFFTPKEIALIMDFPVEQFANDCQIECNKVARAYLAGKLKKEFEVRKSIIQLATSGSSPAQAMSLELIKQANLKQMDR